MTSRGTHLQVTVELVAKGSRAHAPMFAEKRASVGQLPRGAVVPAHRTGDGDGWAREEWEGKAVH